MDMNHVEFKYRWMWFAYISGSIFDFRWLYCYVFLTQTKTNCAQYTLFVQSTPNYVYIYHQFVLLVWWANVGSDPVYLQRSANTILSTCIDVRLRYDKCVMQVKIMLLLIWINRPIPMDIFQWHRWGTCGLTWPSVLSWGRSSFTCTFIMSVSSLRLKLDNYGLLISY